MRFLIANILILPLMLVLPILLQVWLCKREGKWLGLILPALSLVMSLLFCLSMADFSRGEITLEEDGQIIEQQVIEREPIGGGDLLGLGMVFLVFNIPTIVHGAIYLHYRSKREVREEIRRMSVQDLE